MTDAIELKPCPFCGNKQVLLTDDTIRKSGLVAPIFALSCET